MSGGSWNYVSYKFQDVADRLNESKEPERRALGTIVSKIADALHAIEWKDSCDTDDDSKAINEALGKYHEALILKEIIKDAVTIRGELTKRIGDAESEGGE